MKLYIIRGLPGSGKSTYAKSLGCFHVEADFFHFRNGKYKYNPANISRAHEWCQCVTLNAMTNGLDVAVSNTFTMEKEIEPYFAFAKETGHKVVVIAMKNSYGSIHDVPEESMKKLRDRWEDVEGEIIKE